MWIEGRDSLINMDRVDEVGVIGGHGDWELVASYGLVASWEGGPVVGAHATEEAAYEARQWLFFLLSGWIDYETWGQGRQADKAERLNLIDAALITNAAQMKAFPVGGAQHSRLSASSVGLGIASAEIQRTEGLTDG